MSILTKEGIQKILNDDWLLMDDCEGLENCTVIKELARMALAAMDSEPVAEVYQPQNAGICAPLGPSIRMLCPLGAGTKLYLHAQHPLVSISVPDEYVAPVPTPTNLGYEAGWNACRAAMLAAAPQSPGSEPATVPGKWIPVSERMPEDRTQVILWDAEIGEVTSGHYSHKTQTFYHCGDAIENEITHWMPPPSAPQEVKGE
ncbi:TPA: DUF551 domain-containing protein [Klebsiella pneumoniae]